MGKIYITKLLNCFNRIWNGIFLKTADCCDNVHIVNCSWYTTYYQYRINSSSRSESFSLFLENLKKSTTCIEIYLAGSNLQPHNGMLPGSKVLIVKELILNITTVNITVTVYDTIFNQKDIWQKKKFEYM